MAAMNFVSIPPALVVPTRTVSIFASLFVFVTFKLQHT